MSFIITIDNAVNSALNTIRTPLIHNLFWLISFTVYLAVLATLVYFFFVKPATHKKLHIKGIIEGIKYPYAWALAATYAVLFLVLSMIKQYVGRIRPNASDWLSFPSRRAAFAFFVAVTFPAPRKWKTVLYAWATLICISRLVLAEHWLSDVVFGAGIGLLAGFGFKKILKQ